MLIVLTATPNFSEAEIMAEKIVEARLAACVQILPQMKSVYLWEGELHKDPEHLLLIKTLREKYEELHKFIVANHSYTVPEIVAIDADKVSGPYLEWMRELLTDN